MTAIVMVMMARAAAAAFAMAVAVAGCDTPAADTPGTPGAPAATEASDVAKGDDAPKPADAPPAGVDPKVVEWLDKLQARGEAMRWLSADVVYDRENDLTSDQQVRTGTVDYRAATPPEQPSVRFRIDFAKLIVNNAAHAQKREFIFDGSWLVEKDHDKKLFLKRQIVAPGAAFNPINLNGPFPVPIGQKRAEVLAQFEVTIGPDDAELGEKLGLGKPPLHLRLTPRADAPRPQGTKQFARVELWFDRDRLVPVKVITLEGANTTTVTLANVRASDEPADAAADAERFDTEAPGPGGGWRVEISPWQR